MSAPVSTHAVEQFMKRVAILPVHAVHILLSNLACQAMEEQQWTPKCEYRVTYGEVPITMVIRDGYVMTLWPS